VNGDTVRVWLIPLEQPDPARRLLSGVLDDDERRRADAFTRAAERDRFVAAHAATRLILAELLDAPPPEIRWERGPHGKPRLVGAGAGTQTSLSHSGDFAALAVTPGRAVGVDLQRIPVGTDPTAMSRRYFPDEEARYVAAARSARDRVDRFVRLWARKEACVKAAGGRLMQGMKLSVRGVLVHDPGGPLPGPYVVRDVPAPDGFRAAVAVEGRRRYTVSRRRWVTPSV
jgi:4'-phosphopantetheinyl transferase